MTENEAIKELETAIDLAKMCTQNYERKKEIQGYEMAIKALEEVQQYRQIGTVEECREAVEKQPTAYDPNKVVEQLEDYGNEETYYYKNTPYEKCIEECIGKAIEIVKAGGTDGN